MKTVTDTAGREWKFAITFGLAERWKEDGVCDLFDKPHEFQPTLLELIQLFYDSATVEGGKPEDADLRAAMDHTVIGAIEEAWRTELENFTHALNPAMGAGIKEINRIIRQKTTEAEQAAQRLTQKSGINESLTKLLNETERQAEKEIEAATTSGAGESPAS